MEFTDCRISGLQHFHLHEGRDRFDIVRIECIQKAKHDLAPGPETVAPALAPTFAHARHRPLKGVAVQVDRCWKKDADPLTLGWLALLNSRDEPVVGK